LSNTDKAWEHFGKHDPYFGVLSEDKFRHSHLDSSRKAEFFESGEAHVSELYRKIETISGRPFEPQRVLDFGCGVGRLLIPFSRRAQSVTGVDVSESMLKEAANNLASFGMANALLVVGDDGLSRVPGKYHLVHSVLVFQHIPVDRGEKIFAAMLGKMESGGYATIHVSFASQLGKAGNLIQWGRKYLPGFQMAANLLKGKPLATPVMETNCYSLSRLFQIAFESGCTVEKTDMLEQKGFLGVILFLRKAPG